MTTLISLVAFIIICLLFIEFRKRKNTKLKDSVLYIIIERHYKKWYSYNATIINKKTTTLYEVDKVLFELKRILEREGVQNNNLKKYVNFLDGNDNQLTFGVKDVILAILTSFGTNSIIKELVPPISYKTFEEWVTKISKIPNQYKETIAMILTIILVFFLFGLFIWCMYKITAIDSLYKDRQRYSLLERLSDIWEYQEKKEITTIEKILELPIEEREKLVFPDLAFTKTPFEKRLEKTIGETGSDNASFVIEKIKFIKKYIDKIVDFFLSFTLSGSISLFFVFLMSTVIPDSQNTLTKIMMWTVAVLMGIAFLTVYISQLNVYSNDVSFEKRDSSKEYDYKMIRAERRWPAYLITVIYAVFFILCRILGLLNWITVIIVIVIIIVLFPYKVERVEKTVD